MNSKTPQQRFMLLVGLVAAAVYIAAGVYLIRATNFPLPINPTLRIILGFVFIVYAGTRVWRSLR